MDEQQFSSNAGPAHGPNDLHDESLAPSALALYKRGEERRWRRERESERIMRKMTPV